jgi:probable rRNA maturation factor
MSPADAAETADAASLTLDIAYDPPGEARTLFGIEEAALWRIASLTLARVGISQPVEISVLIADDAGIRQLNRDYRGRDDATDVLSFPLLDAPLAAAPADQLWQPPEEEPPARPPIPLPADDLAAAPADDHAPDDADVLASDLAGATDADDAAPGEPPLHLGDIAISREAVVRQAMRAGHSPAWELAYLLAHGVLHLVGYDDQTDAGYAAMVAHQEAVLAEAEITR